MAEPTTQAQRAGIKQIAFVVRDLEASVRAYSDLLGVGPWTAYDLSADVLREMTYHGREARFSLRHALAWQGGVQLELVEPGSGPSIFADHLRSHGEGLHHVGIYVDDHGQAVAEFRAQGFTPIQSACGFGATGDGAFAYFVTDDPLAAIVELIEAPSVRRAPAFVYPPE